MSKKMFRFVPMLLPLKTLILRHCYRCSDVPLDFISMRVACECVNARIKKTHFIIFLSKRAESEQNFAFSKPLWRKAYNPPFFVPPRFDR
ncbi:MAG: hypothetical protein WC554_18000 [Clostridia bacterium]|jgi:hypothetical protein